MCVKTGAARMPVPSLSCDIFAHLSGEYVRDKHVPRAVRDCQGKLGVHHSRLRTAPVHNTSKLKSTACTQQRMPRNREQGCFLLGQGSVAPPHLGGDPARPKDRNLPLAHSDTIAVIRSVEPRDSDFSCPSYEDGGSVCAWVLAGDLGDLVHLRGEVRAHGHHQEALCDTRHREKA